MRARGASMHLVRMRMHAQVIQTNSQHGSITFTAGADYTYTALTSTTRAMTFLISFEDHS